MLKRKFLIQSLLSNIYGFLNQTGKNFQIIQLSSEPIKHLIAPIVKKILTACAWSSGVAEMISAN